MGNNSVELLSIALVREYLSRKGYKNVLQEFDKATNMKNYCVNNRKILAEELNIIDLVKNNKREEKVYKTFIELIVNNLIKDNSQSSKENCSPKKTINHRSKTNLPPEKNPDSSKPTTSDLKRRSPEEEQSKLSKNETSGLLENSNKRNKLDKNDREILDNINPNDVIINNQSTESNSRPITFEEAVSLKEILFGTSLASFNSEWRQQGFQYSAQLRYGLHQEKGGPCGLLAAVQGYVLKHLFYKDENLTVKDYTPDVTSSHQTHALVHALCDILRKVSSNQTFTIALRSANPKFVPNSKYRPDKLTECLLLHVIANSVELESFISKNISIFQKADGCVLFLYSVILTASFQQIKNSSDYEKSTLIGRHGYCTQEMVNLLLTGLGTSNVHDDVIYLGSGLDEKSCLYGIVNKSEIGYLSLFEHYGSSKVGDNYKDPVYPIWLILSESHFSVIFSLDYIRKPKKKFHLFYYDGLANQDEEIKLTISYDEPTCVEPDIESPIELCVQTKWKNVCIDWNGTERLL